MQKILKGNNRVFIIAEAGSNWRCGTSARDQKMARTLIDVAVDAGADAVKFQTYRAKTVYAPNAGNSDYLSKSGIKQPIEEIFKDLEMPYSMIPELAAYCQKRKIIFMSSVFSVEDLKAVNPYVLIHKIASYEITHSRLIEAVAKTKKPLVLSTGASNHDEIAWAVSHFRRHGGVNISLMQCTAKYPAPLKSLNLRAIQEMQSRYKIPIGFSDHSREVFVGPVAAVALGAKLIEKHYTLDNRLPGPDHAFAITPQELKQMVKAIRECEVALGDSVKRILPEENELKFYAQRAIQAMQDISIGDKLEENKNIAILRPGKQQQGIHPKFIALAEGKKCLRAIKSGDGIQKNDFKS